MKRSKVEEEGKENCDNDEEKGKGISREKRVPVESMLADFFLVKMVSEKQFGRELSEHFRVLDKT